MDPNTYKINEAWMDRVEEVVNYVFDDDMYCILNVHHDTGERGWLKANSTNLDQKKDMFTAIWKQVSVNFADYNKILDESANQWYMPNSKAFPISNELSDSCGYSHLKEMSPSLQNVSGLHGQRINNQKQEQK
jgi:aryl-phospho-beta-D-glucosidase BglC (GH1 family)